MAIQDDAKHDKQDLTTEYIERHAKGQKAVANQVDKVYSAVDRLKTIVRSRAYSLTESEWNRAFDVMDQELKAARIAVHDELGRKEHQQGGRRFSWSEGH